MTSEFEQTLEQLRLVVASKDVDVTTLKQIVFKSIGAIEDWAEEEDSVKSELASAVHSKLSNNCRAFDGSCLDTKICNHSGIDTQKLCQGALALVRVDKSWEE